MRTPFSKDRPQGRLRAARPQSAVCRFLGRRTEAFESTSVGCSTLAAPPTLGPVNVPRLLTPLFAAEEGDQPPAGRSQRDWVVDSMLFLLAVSTGALALGDQVGRGLD